ncbi:hypothetical protein SAMN02745220_03831 [Desulfopila aestuarii DSM 18488]|uniref:Uncharacterized protein n=1 Tax=Desulfopila aestuarii DSM 18488 TaxID=1121416 RepID=A0A1M7YEL3_9BACT|nr:hypothetical protein SAMN02745220_03831 [Desulfopila aestuarii DSM 18488]
MGGSRSVIQQALPPADNAQNFFFLPIGKAGRLLKSDGSQHAFGYVKAPEAHTSLYSTFMGRSTRNYNMWGGKLHLADLPDILYSDTFIEIGRSGQPVAEQL